MVKQRRRKRKNINGKRKEKTEKKGNEAIPSVPPRLPSTTTATDHQTMKQQTTNRGHEEHRPQKENKNKIRTNDIQNMEETKRRNY